MNKTTKQYTYQDLIELENQNRNSSIGKMLLSSQQNAPAYGFGTASRYQAQQVFRDRKLMTKGKHTPGPMYNVDQAHKAITKCDPTVKFDQEARKFLDMPEFDYYKRIDNDFDPQEADKIRRNEAPRVRFGLQQRFKDIGSKFRTPGPDYDLKLMSKTQPSYSLGARRPHSVSMQGDTPEIVGPGTYSIDNVMTSNMISNPRFGFTKEPRLKSKSAWDKHQTYDTRQGIGKQIKSDKPTKPAYSVGQGKRDSKQGMLPQHFDRQPVRIRISHPQF